MRRIPSGPLRNKYRITARIRARPVPAGIPNPPEVDIDIYNDTESSIQSLHNADLKAIGQDPLNFQFGGFAGCVNLGIPRTRPTSYYTQVPDLAPSITPSITTSIAFSVAFNIVPSDAFNITPSVTFNLMPIRASLSRAHIATLVAST